MSSSTDDVRIIEIKGLSTPSEVIRDFPRTAVAPEPVAMARRVLHDILRGTDARLAVVVGPCSIHDPVAALDYADRLASLRRHLGHALEIVMRIYFEKPRTTIGWKGLINDPNLDGSFAINTGLRLARKLLIDVDDMGLPAGCEFLDTATPQYIADLVRWAAIGARTPESQIHREMASGLSSPVGFKNGTDGDVRIAVGAVLSASQPHHFLAVTRGGRAAIAATKGNEDCHIVAAWRPNTELRGSARRCRRQRADALRAIPRRDDRRQPCQQRQEAGEPTLGCRECRGPDRGRRRPDHRRHVRKPSLGRVPGPGLGALAALRPEHHRWLPRLGRDRDRARPLGSFSGTPAETRDAALGLVSTGYRRSCPLNDG
jgi:phospho-2-dehydro-3-deoxyheptonate aldolase